MRAIRTTAISSASRDWRRHDRSLIANILGLALLAANSASAVTAFSGQKPASGFLGPLEHRLGENALASAGRVSEKLASLYDLASDFPVAARGAARATTDFVATRNGLVNARAKIGGREIPAPNDGSVFQNREGLLPKQPEGYYPEYVHPTPGVSGPGAQRIVQGQNGELYYTPDHYVTFIPLN